LPEREGREKKVISKVHNFPSFSSTLRRQQLKIVHETNFGLDEKSQADITRKTSARFKAKFSRLEGEQVAVEVGLGGGVGGGRQLWSFFEIQRFLRFDSSRDETEKTFKAFKAQQNFHQINFAPDFTAVYLPPR
jgi:hypothetical protein